MKKKGLIRKIAALIAAAVLLSELPAFPSRADEIGSNTDGSMNQTENSSEEEVDNTPVYNITSAQAEVPYAAYSGMTDWRDRTTYQAQENTYSLMVSTGAKPGDSVLYFDIKYLDSNNKRHSQYVFPGVDALTRSNKLLSYSAGDAIYNSYGKKVADELDYEDKPEAQKELAAWSTQDFVFQTEAKIESVESISVFLGKGSWTVQGISLFSVSEFKGYEEYGLVSGQQFLDYKGELIASFEKNRASMTISTGGVDSSILLCSTVKNSLYGNMKNYAVEERAAKNYAAEKGLYTVRMDMTDQLGSGIESFLNDTASTIKNYKGIVEDIAIEIQYKDINNWTRKVTLPVMLSTMGMLRKSIGDSVILGLAQRGDTVAFQGLFPDFRTLLDATVIYVGNDARKQLAGFGLKEKNAGTQQASLTQTATDDISISSLSFYKGGCLPYVKDGTDTSGSIIKGATVDYAFENPEPMMYYTTSEERGRVIRAGSHESIRMISYTSGAPIVGTSSVNNKYLVTLDTSKIYGGGTKDDISVKFLYETLNGKIEETDTYYVKSAANDYLGEWPTTAGGNLLDEGATGEGSRVSFLIDAYNVKSFTDVEIMVQGQDEWQMKNLIISYVKKVDKRRAYVHDTVKGSSTSKFFLTRDLVSAEIFNLAGTANTFVTDENGNRLSKEGNIVDRQREQVFDSNGNPVYDDDGNLAYVYLDTDESGVRGLNDEQFFKGDTGYKISFNTRTVSDIRDLNYTDVRYSMSFDQTRVNWGFFTRRKTYDVAVKVMDDPDYDNGNGDSGSTNHFFFQLKFDNGNSAYVLANQQLTSDGFRAGKTEVFSISTNQNYGDITGLRIIPEEESSETDAFDKLNIERVTVTEQNNGGACMRYIFDNIGWIDIDYHDELEGISPGGKKAKTAGQLSPVYEVTGKDRAVNLLVEVASEQVYNDYLQFEGAILGEITYISSSTNKLETMSFDVVARMASYMDKVAKSYDASKNNNIPNKAGTNSISDPEWMLRANHRDRFVIPAVADLKTLKSIRFTIQPLNGHPATWNIGDINVAQVLDDGAVRLKANGEYSRAMKTKKLCTKQEKEVTSVTAQAGVTASTPDIPFTSNEIIWSSDDHWATPVSRIPESKDDTVNIYVYPSAHSRTIAGKTVSASLQYGVPYDGSEAVSWESLYAANSGTDKAMFYVTGLSAKNMVSAEELWIQCVDSKIAFDRAVVEHVRDNVVVGIHEYDFADSSAIGGVSTNPRGSNKMTDYSEEVLALSFGSGTETRNLISQELDIAVAFTYTSTIDDTGAEYSSPYVYLTDQGFTQISEGMFAEIHYDVPYVRQITGYKIAAYGNLKGTVEASCAQVYQVDQQELSASTGELKTVLKSKRSYASFISSYTLSDQLVKKTASSTKMVSDNGSVCPVTIVFDMTDPALDAANSALYHGEDDKTADTAQSGETIVINREDSAALASLETNQKVMMVFKYMDRNNVLQSRTYSDITKYIQGDVKSFKSGKDVTVKFFIPEMAQITDRDNPLISVDIYPYTGTAEAAAINPSTIVGSAATIDPDADYDEASMNALSLANPNNGLFLYGVTLNLGFDEKIVPHPGINKMFTGREGAVTLRFSDVALVTYVSKNEEPSKEVVNNLEYILAKSNDIVRATVDVGESLSGFNVKAYRMVGEAGEDVTATAIVSRDVKGFSFVAPENDTDGNMIYKIVISPVDAPATMDIIMVTVEKNEKVEEPTTEPVTQQQQPADTQQPSAPQNQQENPQQQENQTAMDEPATTQPENTENVPDESGSAETN